MTVIDTSNVFRLLGTLFGLQGNAKIESILSRIADGIESGHNVDQHLAGVAIAVKSGAPQDWDNLHARIEADSARLQG